MRVNIDRAKWLRGEGSEDSSLLRVKDGKMCCLGFCMLALGYTKDHIANAGTPATVFNERDAPVTPGAESLVVNTNRKAEYPPLYSNSNACRKAMSVNDSTGMKESDRESDVTKYLAEMGFEAEFFGESKPQHPLTLSSL